jgi:autotransporter translocation and assembly factor TamB
MIKLIRSLLYIFIGLILFLCTAFALIQTKWAKDQIQGKIVAYLNESGTQASIARLSGRLPFSWEIQQADLAFSTRDSLKLSDVKLRIAILPLLRGKIVINYLSADHALYSYFPLERPPAFDLSSGKAWLRDQIEGIALPCQIDIPHFNLDCLEIKNIETGSMLSTGVTGKIALRRDLKAFKLELTFFSPENKKTYLDARLSASKLRNLVEAKIQAHLDEIDSEFDLEGSWTTWSELLYDLPRTGAPLEGTWKGEVANVHFPALPLINRDWKFKTEFSVLSGHEIYLQKLLLLSDLVHLKAKGNLNANLEKSKIAFAYSFPELTLTKIPVSGSLHGKGFYQEGTYKASFEAQDFQFDAFAANTVEGMVKGSYENREWEGEAQFSSPQADLPFDGAFAFEYLPDQSLSINNLNFKISDASLHGYLTCDFPRGLCESSLFANIDHLESFESFFKDKNLGGKLAAECLLSTQENEQNMYFHIIGKNLRFREYLLEDLNVGAKIENLLNTPSGKIDILSEKIYAPSFYLDTLHFSTQSDEGIWPFHIQTEGEIENPFHCTAEGFWRKENSLLSLELIQLSGDLSEIPFSLKYPSEIEWSSSYLTLTPFDFLIGDGQFYATFEATPLRSFGKWDIKHFPLEVFRCFRPRFKLHGFVSSDGFFDATPENIEGSSKTILEEVEVLHFGRKNPFRAKGVLQTHLDQRILQLYTHLYATDQQFLDFAGSFPVDYQLYPFRITFDERKNISGELIAEGKLQELFDFVNLGTNYFSGFLSCRLFLSNTLAAPSLRGKLEWQNGTYENYFTGTSLKNIQAEFEAQNDAIHLIQIKADDDKKGAMTGQGKILLKPKEFFPYAFQAELHNLHALGFDMIDSNLTGPLYFTGNTTKTLAQGNLLIEEAKIHITERLPYEIPTIPFTYVNRPPYLYSRATIPQQRFIFSIDLELTADNKVFVEGRGLNAELEGHVHLYGNNANVAANGALKLIKGEYQFSGKVFKLTEGEIVFNDKPTPSAYLNLNGTLTLPEATITAMLRGPLTSPQLTFQSNPQKATSSILALILFNKDISDISHPEAVQLASTLVSLSGGAGPDVLETIRKSIGVDRLNISSKPGTDEIAVQIGKYLTRGLLITLTQSATSSQVIVEVELPKGFVFQAETQEEEEGKFSLKWTKSY